MKIRKTTVTDLTRVMEIYAYARRFMAEHGNPNQWGPTNWPPRDLIEDDIRKGCSYVCEKMIDYILISHFHPDHMGIAQEIAEHGPVIVVMDVQREYIHAADGVYEKEKNEAFIPIVDDNVKCIRIEESRDFLGTIGIGGEIIHTPGHSDDSISLWTDSGELFVGGLNPLYELELHKGTQIEKSWNRLLKLKPETVYYGHAKTANVSIEKVPPRATDDLYKLVSMIIKNIDRGVSLDKIQKKTGADSTFVEDVARMYLTHRNVGVQGILDRIEIKGR